MAPLWNRIGEAFGGALEQHTDRHADLAQRHASALFMPGRRAFAAATGHPALPAVGYYAGAITGAPALGFIQQEQAADAAANVLKVAAKSSETTAVVSMDAAKAGATAQRHQQASIPRRSALAVAAMVAMVAAVMALLGKVKKFAAGSRVSFRHISISSIPATPVRREFVLRAAKSCAGWAWTPRPERRTIWATWSGPRLAFADGGLVPDVAQPRPQRPRKRFLSSM